MMAVFTLQKLIWNTWKTGTTNFLAVLRTYIQFRIRLPYFLLEPFIMKERQNFLLALLTLRALATTIMSVMFMETNITSPMNTLEPGRDLMISMTLPLLPQVMRANLTRPCPGKRVR